MSASLSRGSHHRAYDPHMGPTAAKIALERGADVVLSRLGFFGEQRDRADDQSAGAVAALRHLLFDESGLHRMRRRDRSEPFQGDDRLALRIRNRRQAGSRRAAVDQHAASTALAQPAPELGGGEADTAQAIEQRLVWIR